MLKQKITDDCPGIQFTSLTSCKFDTFYGTGVSPDSVADFWACARLFQLPMDVGESIRALDKEARSCFEFRLDEKFPPTPIQFFNVVSVGENVVNCKDEGSSVKLPLNLMVQNRCTLSPANINCLVPSELVKSNWSVTDTEFPVADTAAAIQQYLCCRMSGFLRPNDQTGFDSLVPAKSIKASLKGFQQHWLYLHSGNGMFAIHVEDCAAHSINFNFGPCTKVWFLVHPKYTKEVEDAICDSFNPATLATVSDAGKTWRGVLRARRFWPHPLVLLENNIPVVCAIQEKDCGVFVPAGFIHWGYTVPLPQGTFSAAVAWNAFPSACFPAAASFRVLQREFVRDQPAPPRVLQHLPLHFPDRPLSSISESFNLIALAVRQLEIFDQQGQAQRRVLQPGVRSALLVVSAALWQCRNLPRIDCVERPAEFLFARGTAELGWCCGQCEVQVDFAWYENAGLVRCLECPPPEGTGMVLQKINTSAVEALAWRVATMLNDVPLYDYPCLPSVWNSIVENANKFLALRSQATDAAAAAQATDAAAAAQATDAAAAAQTTDAAAAAAAAAAGSLELTSSPQPSDDDDSASPAKVLKVTVEGARRRARGRGRR